MKRMFGWFLNTALADGIVWVGLKVREHQLRPILEILDPVPLEPSASPTHPPTGEIVSNL